MDGDRSPQGLARPLSGRVPSGHAEPRVSWQGTVQGSRAHSTTSSPGMSPCGSRSSGEQSPPSRAPERWRTGAKRVSFATSSRPISRSSSSTSEIRRRCAWPPSAQGPRSIHRALAKDPRQRRAHKEDDPLRRTGRRQHRDLRPGRQAAGRLLDRREFWGRGLATSGSRRAADRGDGTSSPRLRATSNLGSIRVLEKCGFKFVSQDTEFDERLGEEIEEALYVLKD